MGKPVDLELLREILKDDSVHLAVAKIKSLAMANDRSVLRLTVEVFPDGQEQVVRMAWEAVGPGAGFMQLPNPGDLCLIGQAYGDEEHAFVLRMLTSKEDTIPAELDGGDMVAKARAGKKARMISDAKIWFSRPGATPAEPVPLGNILKTLLADFLQGVAEHKHVGNLGYPTAVPDNASVYNQLKASPVNDKAMLSDLTFTEK